MDPDAEPAAPAPATRFDIYKVGKHPFDIVPGRGGRDWMDATFNGYARRCLPMVIANATGWEILSPCAFEADWDGRQGKLGVSFRALDDYPHLDQVVDGAFGHGVLTFRFGLLFRTDPGWAVWLRGAPNFCPDGIHPLDGLVETDWLPFTATMNWRFTRPGRVTFAKGDAIGFVTLIPHLALDPVQPTFRTLDEDPDFAERFTAWKTDRQAVQAAFLNYKPGDQVTYPMHYVRGRMHDGSRAPETHVTKRRLKAPR